MALRSFNNKLVNGIEASVADRIRVTFGKVCHLVPNDICVELDLSEPDFQVYGIGTNMSVWVFGPQHNVEGQGNYEVGFSAISRVEGSYRWRYSTLEEAVAKAVMLEKAIETDPVSPIQFARWHPTTAHLIPAPAEPTDHLDEARDIISIND